MNGLTPKWPVDKEAIIFPDEAQSVTAFLAEFTARYLQQNVFPEFVPRDTPFAGGCLHKDLIFLYSPEKTVRHVIFPAKLIAKGAQRKVYSCYDLVSGIFFVKKRVFPVEKEFLVSAQGQPGIPAHIGFYRKKERSSSLNSFIPPLYYMP